MEGDEADGEMEAEVSVEAEDWKEMAREAGEMA